MGFRPIATRKTILVISLFIPTMNRSEFLIRLLRYYKAVGFKGPIYIGDSSHPGDVERTKEAIKSFRGELNIVYREYPGIDGVRCVQRLLELVSTPYAAFVADDDFMVPAALERCADFLDANPDYSAAHGVGALISVDSNAAYGPVKSAGYYRQPVAEEGSASQRLTSLLQDYTVTLFSVHRVQTWRAMYKDATQVADWKHLGGELLQCCLSVIMGKVKQLDGLYLMRQVYASGCAEAATSKGMQNAGQLASINMSATASVDSFDWITSKAWLPSYEIFRDLVSCELSKQDGISMDEARRVVKQAFWSYLAKTLQHKWEISYGPATAGVPRRFREAAKATPGVRRIWRTFGPILSGGRNNMSLQALLRPSSPDHADFMPIYQAVTRLPTERVLAG